MDDRQLCESLLQLEKPWSVSEVKVSHKDQRVDIWLEHEPNALFTCSECGKTCPLHDHAKERIWRHLDAFQFHTYIHARIPRVRCQEHGVRHARVSWAEPNSRFTEIFERKIVGVLLNTWNLSTAGRLLDLNWAQMRRVMKRAVERGMSRREIEEIHYLGVDEKAWKKGHSYFTVVADLEQKRILDIAVDRRQESLEEIYNSLPKSALKEVKAIAMDMWQAFLSTTLAWFDSAQDKIVHDRFHCMQIVIKALDEVRRKEAREQSVIAGGSLKYSRYALGKNPEKLTDKQSAKLEEILAGDLKTGEAWALKENFRKLWEQPDRATAEAHFDHWLEAVERSGIRPMQKAAQTMSARRQQILNWYEHKVSTGIVEALNGKIMTIKRLARGHRNLSHLRDSILFFLGGLDLSTVSESTHSKV